MLRSRQGERLILEQTRSRTVVDKCKTFQPQRSSSVAKQGKESECCATSHCTIVGLPLIIRSLINLCGCGSDGSMKCRSSCLSGATGVNWVCSGFTCMNVSVHGKGKLPQVASRPLVPLHIATAANHFTPVLDRQAPMHAMSSGMMRDSTFPIL